MAPVQRRGEARAAVGAWRDPQRRGGVGGGRGVDARARAGGGGGGVQVVAVDVDLGAAVGLVVRTLVLVQALVGGPFGARHVGIDGRLLVVPVGDPQLVGLDVAGPELGHEVSDPRRVAGVDARQVPAGVQLGGPCLQEGEHRAGVGARPVVSLHVEVEGVARAHADRLCVDHGVLGGLSALDGGRGRGDPGAAARVRGRLQANVDGDHVPAGRGLRADPRRRQVGLRAGHVGAADVEADGPVGGGAPVGHRRRARGAARVKAQAGVGLTRGGGGDGRRRRGGVRAREGVHPGAGGGHRGARARAHGRLHGTRQRNDVQRAADHRRLAVPGRGDEHPMRGVDDLRLGAGASGPGGGGGGEHLGRPRCQRLDQDRLGAAGDLPRAALLRRGAAEVDGVAVEAHAGGGGGGQLIDRPARRHGQPVAVEGQHLGRGRGQRGGGKQENRDHHRQEGRDQRGGPAAGCRSARSGGHAGGDADDYNRIL